MSDYLELNGNEKKQVVKSQLKNIQMSKYALELSILQENAIPNPSEGLLDAYSNDMSLFLLKEQVLEDRLNELNNEYPETDDSP